MEARRGRCGRSDGADGPAKPSGTARHPDGLPRRRGAHHAAARRAGRAVRAGGRGDDARGGGAARDPSGRRATVIRYDKRGADRGLARPLAAGARLRARRYARAYLPHRSWRSAALALLAGARGADRLRGQPGGGDLHPPGPAPAQRARGRAAAGLAGQPRCGGPPPVPAVALGLTAEDRAAADAWLRERGVAPGFVALAPGSIWGTKRWPCYAELAAALDAPVVVIGGPDDAVLADASRGGGAGPRISAAGELGLRASAALIARAAVLVTNDSAPLHLATAVGTPIVAMFGPTVPAFGFGPRGRGDVIVEHAGARLPSLLRARAAGLPPGASPLHAGAVGRVASPRRWRRRQAWRRIVRFVLGIDIGGTNLVVGSVAEDGSALHALVSEPTQPESGATDVMDRLVALAERAIAQTRREVPGAEILGVGRRRARARSTPRAASCCSRRTSAGSTCRSARSSTTASACLRRSTTTPTARCWASGGSAPRAARATPSASPSAPASAAGSSSTASCTTAHPTGRRDRSHHHRDRGTPLQVRQLRLPRGLRVGSRHRAARRGGGGGGRVSRLAAVVGGDLRDDHGADRLRGGEPRRRGGAPGGERDRQVPRHRHREPGQRVQSRGGGGVRWRDPRGRPPLRAAPARGGAPRLQARGGGVPHRPGRAHGHGRRVRRRAKVFLDARRAAGKCRRSSASSGPWSGT